MAVKAAWQEREAGCKEQAGQRVTRRSVAGGEVTAVVVSLCLSQEQEKLLKDFKWGEMMAAWVGVVV